MLLLVLCLNTVHFDTLIKDVNQIGQVITETVLPI